jgi:hypothetical protein
MIYLSGSISVFRHPRLGFLLTPDMGQKAPAGALVAADNGCFTNPDHYSDERYEIFLRGMPPGRTLFATAPDVLGSHAQTVKHSLPMLRRIRALRHQAAFVAQDGWRESDTPWDEFDVLFVGGSTEFKFRGGRDAVRAAKRHGKRAHMGRVNSLERLRAAAGIGCDTADGTFLKFAPTENWDRMMVWFDAMETQPGLAV